MIPVYLSGGSGTRLWPLSRQSAPKQFLPLVSHQTMLQETIHRIGKTHLFDANQSPMVICSEPHRFMVAEQLRELGLSHPSIILEPEGKNTAAAIAIACCRQAKVNPDAILAVFPSDHIIANQSAFDEALKRAQVAAAAGAIVILGIVPTHPETGYGYIQANCGKDNSHPVKAFIEKPSQDKAAALIAQGDCFWNGGMFIFQVKTMLSELQRWAPDLLGLVEQSINLGRDDEDFFRLDRDTFAKVPSISIDHAVMEKTQKAIMVPLDAGWSDIGSWAALWQENAKNAQGNVIQGDVITYQTNNSLLESHSRLVAVVGVDNLVVVETADAVLVMPRDKAADMRGLIDVLKQNNRQELDTHTKVYRPWGHYETLAQGQGYQVKRLMVKPHGRLSLQYHHHRSEHWVVVQGTAEIQLGDKTFFLPANQSTYIPAEVAHRLSNPGEVDLLVIEVQSGEYLGEDDIVRIEDHYGRTNS